MARALLWAATASLVATTVLYTWSDVGRASDPTTTVTQPAGAEVDARLLCLAGVVTVQPGGRLANRILEYASAWSLARVYGLRAAASLELLRSVGAVYEGLSAATLEDEAARCDADFNVTAAYVLRRPTTEVLYPVADYVHWARISRQPLVLRKWIVLTETIVQVLPELREEFKLKEQFKMASSKVLSSVRERMVRDYGDKEVIFVGLHVRRTDYQAYLHYKFGAKKFADVPYFRSAVELMRSYLANEGGVTAFVITSDDPRWCLQTLIPVLRDDLKAGLPPSKLFFVSARKDRHAGHDLSVLSSCNHSIIAYGTYGIWSALMAGGRTIVFDIGHSNNPNVSTKTTAMRLARMLPNWVAIT